jgi:uncharacterized membrane protein YphA (DoxX/SURF4 family)
VFVTLFPGGHKRISGTSNKVKEEKSRNLSGDRTMNILLWVLQGLLAAVFLAHGLMLLFPPASLVAVMNATINPAFRLFIGAAEVLAAIGLTLPGITRIKPWLVPAAAAGLMIVMIGAVIFHVKRGEVSSAITYMRWKVRPILPRVPAGQV